MITIKTGNKNLKLISFFLFTRVNWLYFSGSAGNLRPVESECIMPLCKFAYEKGSDYLNHLIHQHRIDDEEKLAIIMKHKI